MNERILLINPNCSVSCTEGIAAAVAPFAARAPVLEATREARVAVREGRLGEHFEVVQKMSDAALTEHPVALEKLPRSMGFSLNGSQFTVRKCPI